LTLQFLENADEYESYVDWVDFKWKLSAFIEIQDIFDAPLYNHDFLNGFCIWYFYFESKYLLTEAILCGLNGLYCGCHSLLRLLVEFNTLQNYYYRIASITASYELLERYFKSHAHPSWGTILKGALPADSFSRPIRLRLQSHLKALSEIHSHPYHPDHSPRQHTIALCKPSLEGIFFWEGIRLLLDAVLWVYYVNFPMVFHPRNTLKKFGFNGPVGLFIDEIGAYIVRKSLKEDDYESFLLYSSSHDTVKDLMKWYASRSNLTDEEIIGTWNKAEYGSEPKSVLEGYVIQMGRLRAIREAMALKPLFGVTDRAANLDIDIFFSYSFWNKMLKRKMR